MTRSSELPRLLYGSNLCRTKYIKGRSLLCIFVEPNTLRGVLYFASFYFHFHQNQTVVETEMDKKIWALGYLPEKKDDKRRRRKREPECG